MVSEWSLYLIRCADGKLYTGISTDVEQRLGQHAGNKGAKFMRGRAPFQLAFSHPVGSRSEASKLEWKVKKLPRIKKELLIRGELLLAEV